jgi:hypothetical protein
MIKIWQSSLIRLALTASFSTLTLLTSTTAKAAVFDLTNGNSTAHFDSSSFLGGFYSWTVDGIDQLLNPDENGEPGSMATLIRSSLCDTSAIPITPGTCLFNENVTSPSSDKTTVTYDIEISGNKLGQLTMDYQLVGGVDNSGYSQIIQKIKVTNISAEDRTYDFFQYYNLNLTATPDNDQLAIPINGIATQTDFQTLSTTDTTITGGNLPVNYYNGSSGDLLGDIGYLDATGNLPIDATSPTPIVAGNPGDFKYVYQWNILLHPGQEAMYQQTTTIAAQPVNVDEFSSPLAFLSFGGFLGLASIFRRSKK